MVIFTRSCDQSIPEPDLAKIVVIRLLYKIVGDRSHVVRVVAYWNRGTH